MTVRLNAAVYDVSVENHKIPIVEEPATKRVRDEDGIIKPYGLGEKLENDIEVPETVSQATIEQLADKIIGDDIGVQNQD